MNAERQIETLEASRFQSETHLEQFDILEGGKEPRRWRTTANKHVNAKNDVA